IPPRPPRLFHLMRPIPVPRATDDRGTTVTEIVSTRDGHYLDTFGRGPYQGVTREHWVEVEVPALGVGRSALGTTYDGRQMKAGKRTSQTAYIEHGIPNHLIPNAQRLTPIAYLVAQGWIHPTDSSVNLAISQGRHVRPKGLSVEVPDGRGGWRTLYPNLGF